MRCPRRSPSRCCAGSGAAGQADGVVDITGGTTLTTRAANAPSNYDVLVDLDASLNTQSIPMMGRATVVGTRIYTQLAKANVNSTGDALKVVGNDRPPVYPTQHLSAITGTTDVAVHADWSELYFVSFGGGVEFWIDDISVTNQAVLRAYAGFDALVRRPAAFAQITQTFA